MDILVDILSPYGYSLIDNDRTHSNITPWRRTGYQSSFCGVMNMCRNCCDRIVDYTLGSRGQESFICHMSHVNREVEVEASFLYQS